MNKRAFTLTEVLTVIVILTIVVLVAVPTFNKYVINFEDNYYENLKNNVKYAGMEYFNENPVLLPDKAGFYSEVTKDTLLASGIIDNVTDSEGNPCERFDVIVKKNKNSDYEYEPCIKCGNYETTAEVCGEDFNINGDGNDNTGPDVADIYVSNKTTNSVTVNAVCVDEESGIKEYWYSKDGGETYPDEYKTTSPSYKFDNLKDNQSYTFKVKCISNNGIGSSRESTEVTALTARFTNPSIKLVTTENGFPRLDDTGKEYEYSPERDAQITYNDYNIEEKDVQYFLRSTVDVKPNVDVYECTGDLNTLDQNSCLDNPSKTMLANVWYKTKNVITTSTFATDTENGNHILYAQIGDTVNLSGISNYEITKIDVTPPTIKALANPKTLGNQNYDFLTNVTYTYGYSGGNVSCNPPSSKKTSTYSVTCRATGNNGLTEETTFEVKHNYPAKRTPKTCSACVCNFISWCFESSGLALSPCSGSSCFCCTDVSCTDYDCSTYSCPNGGKLKGTTCYY